MKSSWEVGFSKLEGVSTCIYIAYLVIALRSFHVILAFVFLDQRETVWKVVNGFLKVSLEFVGEAHVFKKRNAFNTVLTFLLL